MLAAFLLHVFCLRLPFLHCQYLVLLTKPLNKARADDGAGELEQGQMGAELPLEADTQLAESGEPGVRTLDHPAVTTEPFAALAATSCDAALNAAPA